MDDLQAVVDTLQGLNRDVRQILPTLDSAFTLLSGALDDLRDIDDPHARNAEVAIHAAQGEVRQAVSGWLNDYQYRSDDLCHRIAS